MEIVRVSPKPRKRKMPPDIAGPEEQGLMPTYIPDEADRGGCYRYRPSDLRSPDHGEDFEICKQVIDGGFNSVMIDGSKHPFEENVRLTKQVVDYAWKGA